MAKEHEAMYNGFVEDPNKDEFNAAFKKAQEIRYRIVIHLANNSTRRFDNCDYSVFSSNGIKILTADGIPITFIGNYCAEIVKMEDFNKIRK